MSETNESIAQSDENSPAGFSPITTQEAFDHAIQGRLSRAEKNFEKKYKDVFEKAKAYDQMQEQGQSELEKAQSQVNELEIALQQLKRDNEVTAWKKQASDLTGVPFDVIKGETEKDINDHARALEPYFTKMSGYVGSDGMSAVGKPSTRDQFARAMGKAL